jgi:UDP-2-acetamido-3-amino-2,3-dideoxy-glucuronate N-acetyltransferase
MARRHIHPTADVSPHAQVGSGSHIWNHAQIREEARIGCNCIIGKNVYVDRGVVLGDGVKVQNNVSIYHGVLIEDGVFIGPHVCFTNDALPRAMTLEGTLKGEDNWVVGHTVVRREASIGAGSVILPNVTIGSYALIGAGSVVTRSVPAHALVYGNPARQHGYVCRCGRPLATVVNSHGSVTGACPTCQQEYTFHADFTADEQLEPRRARE